MGGSSNDASRQAERNERERQAQIAQSTGRINAIFDDPSRQAQYDKLASDTTAFYTSDLDRQKAENERKLKFALARSGLSGSSVQADKGEQLGEDYLRGVVEATRRGNAAGATLRGADEQSRLNLLAMAQTGLDATTAGSRAASSLKGNLEAGMADSTANGLGDFFGGFADLYRRSQERKGEQSARKYDYGTFYQPIYGGRQ